MGDSMIGLIELVGIVWLVCGILKWAFSGPPRRPRSYPGSTREFLRRK